MQPHVWGDRPLAYPPVAASSASGVGGEESDDLASAVSNPWLWINSPVSRLLSAPPQSDFASLFALSTPESRRPPSVSLSHGFVF